MLLGATQGLVFAVDTFLILQKNLNEAIRLLKAPCGFLHELFEVLFVVSFGEWVFSLREE